MVTGDAIFLGAFIVLLLGLTVIPLIFRLNNILIAALLGWFGLGIFLVSTYAAATAQYVTGFVCLMMGLFCAFEYIKRSQFGTKPIDDEEEHRKEVYRIVKRGRDRRGY